MPCHARPVRFRRSPARHEVKDFSLVVFPHFKYDGIKFSRHPANCHVLLGPIRPAVHTRKQFLRFLETYTPLGVCRSSLLFRGSKENRIWFL